MNILDHIRKVDDALLLANDQTTFRIPRSRDFAGTGAIPTLNTSLGTQVLSAANAASTIANGVQIMPNFENYRVIGTDPQWGLVYPDYTGWKNTLWTKASSGPWAVEFDWDTTIGVLEVLIKGNGIPAMVMLNGQYLSATPVKPPADGSTYTIVVTAAAGSGRYRVRLELDGNITFYGVRIGPTDSITASPKRPIRAVWVGDSFAEPTISDTNNAAVWQGVSMGSTFGWITGWEIVHAGLGGTGMVNPGTTGRVKYADRMAEVLALKNLDIVIYQMSGNDSAQTTASVLTQVQALIDMAKAAGFTKYGQIIFMSSWWTQYSQSIPSLIIDQNMQAKALCRSQNVIFVDTLMPDVPNAVTTTITSSPGSNTSNITTATQIPAPAPLGSTYAGGQEVYVVIGNPGATNLEIKKVSTSSATTVSVTPNLRSAHAAGERIMQIGSSPLTGTGRQGATTGVGNADRYTGPDTTHPTIAGHRWRGIAYAARLSTILPH